ncbi:MAG TPA: peptidoglycan recognition family protein [Steroidobacteraceae bacterium]|nr:peptidoglycan recognition family protein [Steroidobacteraceae bacterium]
MASASFHPERVSETYRRERHACNHEMGAELSRITDDIDDPVVKLRYLRSALDAGDEARVGRLPTAAARKALYRLRGLEALDSVLQDGGAKQAVGEETLAARRKARWTVLGSVVAAVLIIPAMLAGLAVKIEPPPQAPVGNLKVENEIQPPDAAESTEAAMPVAESLPQETLGITPSTIWLADRGQGWELYSNGLRIETSYAVAGKPRQYHVYRREGGLQKEVYTKPAGILFHTSESDLWPLEEGFQQQLRKSSENLLRYLRREQAYNYLIDRFGRVYRVVEDETRANHAGRSIWARNDEVYLDLNSAFLGVSFESRWDGGRTLPITRAQLIAGRNLTNLLRQRFAIAPEMCVTHGLTSVNPSKRLIGYHRDWARGFPFEAFGLPDQYAQPLPSIAIFGFGYDDEFLHAVGERWPGLIAAEQLLTEEARSKGMTLDAIKRDHQLRYQKWVQEAPSLENVAVEVTRHTDKRG